MKACEREEPVPPYRPAALGLVSKVFVAEAVQPAWPRCLDTIAQKPKPDDCVTRGSKRRTSVRSNNTIGQFELQRAAYCSWLGFDVGAMPHQTLASATSARVQGQSSNTGRTQSCCRQALRMRKLRAWPRRLQRVPPRGARHQRTCAPAPPHIRSPQRLRTCRRQCIARPMRPGPA